LDRFYGALLVLGAALPFIYDPARQAFLPARHRWEWQIICWGNAAEDWLGK